GAQYGVDPTLGGRTNPAAESIIDITGIGVANPNVAVELTSGATGASVAGFTVIGSPTFNYADETVFRAWCGDLTIEDNIIDGYIGVLHKGGVSTGISRNLMTVNKNGIILQPGIYDSFTIDGNVAMLGSTPAGGESALYMTGATNISVTGNDFTSFPNGNAVGGSNNSNVTISGNNLSHCKKGVNFWGNTTFIDVIDNTIYNCSDAGVNIKGQDLSVTGNIFGGCSIGFEVGVHTLTTERVTAFNNDFSGCSTAGVVVSPSVSEMVDASGNFWGSAVPAQVRAKANGGADIDYTPWLASGLFMNPGFSGDFSTLWVDDDSDQTGTTGRVQEGIDLVSGSTLRLAPGTYLERPVASKSVYIRGDTQANTFIDAGVGATGGSYGFTVSADDVTVAYLTLLGDTGLSTPRYGFKASQVSNFTMLHVTAKEFYRTGVDLLGVTNGDLQYVTSIDNDGHGLALTDCNGVHIASLSVGGNAWQGVSVATWGRYSPLGTSGIVFQYPNNFDDPFQLEMGDYNNPGVPPAGDAIITYSTSIGDGADVTVSASEFGFAVHGEQDDAPDQARIWFAETFADAAALVATPQSHFTGDGMYVESLTDATQLYVTTGGSIQAAIDAADDYDTINVSAGTYVEALLIEKPVSVLGATAGINKNGYAVPAGYAWDDAVESIIVHPDPASGYVTIVDIHDTDDVVFKGFVVGELSAVGNLNTSLVRVYAHSFAIDNIVVENNVIGPNTNTVSQDGTHGRMGLYLVNHPYSDQGITNSSFSHNKIFDTKGNGDNIFLWTSYYAYGAPGPASMAGTVIDDNEIYGSHRAGIETAGGFSDLTISNNTIYGNSGLPGDDPDKLKYGHGILLIRGSSDKVSNPLTAFGPVDLVITGNNIYDNEKSGIYTGPKNDGIYIENNLIHDNGWNGMIVDLAGNYWNPQFESPPVSEQYACYDCAQNVFVNDNMIWGNAGAGTPASDYGVAVNGVPTNGFILDAEDNWWGDPTGPYHATVNPTGLGEKVTDYVDFDPYRTGNIICDPDPEYLSLSIPGTTIDVDYLGGGSGLIYGYNVTVTWDDALVEAVPGDVTQGTLLSSAGSTFFNVQQPSSSELTIDCIILGAHSGVTGPGTMFSIDFDAKVPVGYGVSPVDITVNRVRDYANQTLTGFFADDGEIIVDTVAPVISYVHVTNWTLTHTDDYIKDTDHATVDALVTDAHPSFGLTNIDGDLVGLGGGASVNPNSYGGGTATWDLPSVTCDPSDGTVTVTVTATDAHGNSSNLSDTIIADNTAPTAVTGFDAAPAYGECDLTWTNGSDTYYYGTVVRREAIGGEYPQYPWFVSNWATGVDSAYP
ncbi:MAG TPA: right-handed parallel beta-helix repeat-containing protein, partial [bacterium]|nr:right-handed parallel beta-helix repeat-containing protein [bacterium]